MADNVHGRRDESPPSGPLDGIADVVDVPLAPAGLDEIDLRLLLLLANDSRLSQRGLARDLQISAPTVGERLARLERIGLLRGYTVDVDWSALGFPMQVFLSLTVTSDQAQVLTMLARIAEVEQVAVVTGSMDLIARLRVRDYAHLRHVLLERVWSIAGVIRTETMISLAEVTPSDFRGGMLRSRLAELERAD